MDTRFFGSNLVALNEIQDHGRRPSKEGGEDAYYERHTPRPAVGRILRIASSIAAGWFGFMAFGSGLQ